MCWSYFSGLAHSVPLIWQRGGNISEQNLTTTIRSKAFLGNSLCLSFFNKIVFLSAIINFFWTLLVACYLIRIYVRGGCPRGLWYSKFTIHKTTSWQNFLWAIHGKEGICHQSKRIGFSSFCPRQPAWLRQTWSSFSRGCFFKPWPPSKRMASSYSWHSQGHHRQRCQNYWIYS
jgi:hypothetical protein